MLQNKLFQGVIYSLNEIDYKIKIIFFQKFIGEDLLGCSILTIFNVSF